MNRARMIDTNDIYHRLCGAMSDSGTAKIFMHGRSQAVRLPKEFRLTGEEVRVTRVGRGVLLEPIERDVKDIKAWFAKLDRLGGEDFLPEGRPEQPPMPVDDISFDK